MPCPSDASEPGSLSTGNRELRTAVYTVPKLTDFSATALDGDKVGYIYALTLDGKLEWKSTYGEEWTENFPGARATPSIIGDMLYMYSGKGVVTCMNAINGKVNWTKDVMKDYNGQNITWGVTETLVIDGNKLFITVGGTTPN